MKRTLVLILIISLIMVGAGFLAAKHSGFLNTLFPQIGREDAVDNGLIGSPLETENEQLRAEKKELTYQLTILEQEKTKLLEQITELQTELTEIKGQIAKQETKLINTEDLAAYYQEMKPDAVVRIMDNLDDEMVVTILALLDKKQTAKIIALMDPYRAALITQLLLNKQIP